MKLLNSKLSFLKFKLNFFINLKRAREGGLFDADDQNSFKIEIYTSDYSSAKAKAISG